MPKLDKRLLAEVATTVLGGQTALFLTPTTLGETTGRQEVADRIADRFRKAFVEKAMELRHCAELTARKLLRPEGSNPSFVRMVDRETGWVFFHPAEDISEGDEVGTPAFVYWPTEGADYQKISYLLWRRERRSHIWRPVHFKGALDWEDAPVAPTRGPRVAWDALFDDEL